MYRSLILLIACVVPAICNAQLNKIKPGDILQVNGVKGIVFMVNEEGTHGQMMTVQAFRGKKDLYCSKSSYLKGVTMQDDNNGAANTAELLAYASNNGIALSNYPVYNWCKSLGMGWYIPAVNQLKSFVNYWVGNTDVEVDWEEDGEDTIGFVDETIPHTEQVNVKLLEAGGIPFLNGVFTSTLDENKRVEVFYYQKEDGKWKFEKLNPKNIDAFCVGRAFYDF